MSLSRPSNDSLVTHSCSMWCASIWLTCAADIVGARACPIMQGEGKIIDLPMWNGMNMFVREESFVREENDNDVKGTNDLTSIKYKNYHITHLEYAKFRIDYFTI